MHNLWTVVWFEFVRTVKKKSFWLSVLALPAIIGIVVAVAYFSGQAADTASQKAAAERFSMAITDRSGIVSDNLINAGKIRTIASKDEGVELVKRGEVDAYFYIPADVSKEPVEAFGQDVGLVKNDKYGAVALQLLRQSLNDVVSAQQASVVRGDVSVRTTTYEDGAPVAGLERAVAPGAILVLFYITFVLMAGRMLASTTEEKENRVIEMLLSNVQPRTLVTGKILSLLLIGLTQVATIGLLVGLIVWLARDSVSLPSIDISRVTFEPLTMLISIVTFVAAYVLFTGILVAIGSAVPTAKEAGSFMGVAMFGLFVPLYAVQAIIADPSQLLVKIFTYFPLTSPITLLIRNTVGNLSTTEALVSIGLLALAAALAIWVASRIFGYGTLEYSRKLSWREIFVPQ
jgi:ABC-2 type transport system permease protein